MKGYLNSIIVVFACAGALFLSACGDDYEVVRYTGSPYGNERTAGGGVAFVRAKMMPEKGPVLKGLEIPEELKAGESVEPKPVDKFPKEAEELFKRMQKK